ncbi:hypothetical protein TIFTF001_033343 [Ficus carica]|uniref:Uncharacterized protein n=1 Tax=Ficus carica TaxID=3494 RepID=A0AA88J3M0_FICCA|nr:hypothetical protein TIFTF001_033343 [Ficus carica]
MQDASPQQHATSEKSRMPDQEKMQDASPRQDATSEKQRRRPFRNLLEDSGKCFICLCAFFQEDTIVDGGGGGMVVIKEILLGAFTFRSEVRILHHVCLPS